MEGRFKLGDQVRIVSEDVGRVSLSEPYTIDKVHKGNGNLIVDGQQFDNRFGFRTNTLGWRVNTRLVLCGSADCQKFLAKHRRQTALDRLRHCDWSVLPDDALERVCGLLKAELAVLKRDSKNQG